MQEEQENKEPKKKKKPNLLRKILRWIGLGLLSLLIIAALFFQAPWKVTTLLIIFLLAHTALSKSYRKWFWATVGVIIIALIAWVFLPDKNEGWKPYKFDKDIAALQAKYAVPDKENAALVYETLFVEPLFDGNKPDFFIHATPSAKSDFWHSKDHPEMAEWLGQNQNAIEMLMQACQKDKCLFPIAYDPVSLGDTMEYLAPMRRLAYLLISAANNDMGEGRIDAGLEKCLCVVQMGKHLCQQPALVDKLVGFAIEALALRQFNRFVITGDASEKHLVVIEDALADIKYNWSSDLTGFIECDKLMQKGLLSMFYEISPGGKTRLTRDPYAQIRPFFKEQLEKGEIPEDEIENASRRILQQPYWQKKLIKTSIIFGWFFLPSTPQKGGEIIDASYERYYAMAKPDYDQQKEPRQFFVDSLFAFKPNFQKMIENMAGTMEGVYYNIHEMYLKFTAKKRGCQILIELARYKNKHTNWPRSLDDLKNHAPAEIFVDPLNNSNFIYRLTDDGFTLYSKGKNNIDENGEYNATHGIDLHDVRRFSKDIEEDDILIWPPKSRKTEVQDPNDK